MNNDFFEKIIANMAVDLAKKNIPRHLDSIEKGVQNLKEKNLCNASLDDLEIQESLLLILTEIEKLVCGLEVLKESKKLGV